MAILHVQDAKTNGTTALVETVSLTGVGVGNLLSLSVFTGNGAEVASVVDSQGNFWIRGCQANASGSLTVESWYASGVVGGTTAASVTLASTPATDFTCVMVEFSGVSSVNAMDQEVPNAGTGTAANTGASVQGFTTGTLFISTVVESGATLTVPSGFTSVTTGRTFDGVSYLIDSGQSMHNPSWTLSGSELWLTNTISFTTPQVNAPVVSPTFNNGWPFPQIQVEWSPTSAPFTPVWRNVSRYVRNFKTTQGRQHQLDRIEAGSIDITFDGRDGTFNPWNTSSFLFNNFQGLQPMNAIRITAAWKGVTYPVAYGYVQSVTPILADSQNVDVDVKCWDILQFLSLRYLSGQNYSTLIMTNSPTAYYRLGDAVGSFTVLDSSGNSNTGSLINGPTGSPAFGAQGVLLYDGNGALDLTNGQNTPGGGFAMVDNTTEPPTAHNPLSAAGDWSFECWIQYTGGTANIPAPATTGSASVAAIPNDILFRFISGGHEVQVQVGYIILGSGISETTLSSAVIITTVGVGTNFSQSVPIFDGNWHHFVMTGGNVYFDGTALSGGVGGLSNPTNMTFGCAPQNVTGVDPSGGTVFAGGFAGIIDEVALYSSNLSSGTITSHYNQGYWFRSAGESGAGTGGIGVSAVGRLNHVLAVAGFGGVYGIGAAYITPVYGESNPIVTTTALDYIQILMETEPGIIFQAQDGNIYALNRQYVTGHGGAFGIMNSSQAATSNGIFGDTSGSTYRFEYKGFDVGQDDLDIWNDIQAQSGRSGQPAPVLQEVNVETDTTGIATLSSNQYGVRTLQGLTNLLFLRDSDALAVAQQYLRWYAAGIQRAPSISIQNTANQGVNIPQMLDRTLYDRITLQYQGQTAGGQFTQESIIESISHDVDVLTGIWRTDFACSPYEISLVQISTGGPGVPPSGSLTSINAAPMVLGVFKFGDTTQLLL